MLWIAAGLAFSLLVIGTPVVAEEFSMIVTRGSTVVRVTGNEDGETREETLREDPTPDPSATKTRARVASHLSNRIVVEEAKRPAVGRHLVAQSRIKHHRYRHVRSNRHASSHRGRGIVFSRLSAGAEEPRRGWGRLRSKGPKTARKNARSHSR